MSLLRSSTTLRTATILVAWAASSLVADAQKADFVPPAARGIGVTQLIGESLPLEAAFRDTRGEAHTLGEYFAGERPVLLTFNYSDCPQLCSLQLNSLVGALREIEYTIGEDFEVVTVSIDPKETPARAALTQERYFHDYLRVVDAVSDTGRRRTEARGAKLTGEARDVFGWHFLTSDAATIASVANAAGFAFNLDPQTGDYAHDAVVIVLTPQGTISRYLPGVFYEPKNIEIALVSASQGQLGGVVAWLRQTCYRWDHDSNTYVLVAERLMTLGAGMGAVLLFGFLALLWRREYVAKIVPTTGSADADSVEHKTEVRSSLLSRPDGATGANRADATGSDAR